MSYDAPFAGLKVVDLSQGIAGPYCAMLLAQYGADVIKVEGIGEGDWARTLGTRYGSHSAYSIIGNLGKKSIAVDLKSEAGKQVVWRLLKGADIFLEGFRPGVIQRLGFDYKSVAAREPRLLYLSISGFGQTGPLSSRPAMDPVLQAYTGLMNENRGEDGIPHRVPVIVVDMSTALYAFQALSAALYARRDETRGRYIDVSLMQAATALQSIRLMACHLEGGVMKPGGAPGGVFKIADGWMSLLAFNDRDWRILCKAMQTPALADDPRAGRRSALCDTEAAARQRRGAVRHRAARHRRRAVGRVDQTADRSRPDARAAQQLRGIPRPTACARDRPDPVAHAGRTEPGRAGSRPARHAAPGRGHTPRNGARHRPAHDRGPGRARLCRRRDRRAAGARDSGQRRMKTAPREIVP
jgi:crotonobetainyl-CoA:carnitine CoA-transferase CaiB-like acyl-CoA transferase